MDRQVEISFRNMAASRDVETLIRREAGKLERYVRDIIACRVAIERPQRSQRTGNAHRVRIFITAAGREPVVVAREPTQSDMHDDLRTILLGAFKAARRRLQSETERMRTDRAPTPDEPRGLVVRLFRKAGYGFLRTLEGREV